MILPREMIENVSHYHATFMASNRGATAADSVTIYWKQWWKRRTKFDFPRVMTTYDEVTTMATYEAVPAYYEIIEQLRDHVEATYDEDPEPPITTKKEGNVYTIERTKT